MKSLEIGVTKLAIQFMGSYNRENFEVLYNYEVVLHCIEPATHPKIYFMTIIPFKAEVALSIFRILYERRIFDSVIILI